MSDFDKEAEREKLREKYERDKQEREATQRMSDLLLKGARMTNSHCDACGDPLFEQNDTTFCPSCHGGPAGVQAKIDDRSEKSADDPGDAADGTSSDDANEVDSADVDSVQSDIGSKPAIESSEGALAGETGESRRTESVTDSRQSTSNTARGSASASRGGSEPTAGRTDRGQSPRSNVAASDGDLEAARNALVESLERFATEAATTDDPRYARDCLEAAREASEALAALR